MLYSQAEKEEKQTTISASVPRNVRESIVLTLISSSQSDGQAAMYQHFGFEVVLEHDIAGHFNKALDFHHWFFITDEYSSQTADCKGEGAQSTR